MCLGSPHQAPADAASLPPHVSMLRLSPPAPVGPSGDCSPANTCGRCLRPQNSCPQNHEQSKVVAVLSHEAQGVLFHHKDTQNKYPGFTSFTVAELAEGTPGEEVVLPFQWLE